MRICRSHSLSCVFIFIDINECENLELCENNGTCINNNGSYTCNCSPGWQDKHCQKGMYIQWTSHALSTGMIAFEMCALNSNDIYLLQFLLSDICLYMFLFFFPDINECEMLLPCQNNGTCLNNNGSYVCICKEGWQGYNCEDGIIFVFNSYMLR